MTSAPSTRLYQDRQDLKTGGTSCAMGSTYIFCYYLALFLTFAGSGLLVLPTETIFANNL
jgi:hypothetical protein